jgi:DNA processing protein
LAAGTNALIRDGAHLVTGPQDALDLVFGVGRCQAAAPPPVAPRLRTVLAAIREGRDTLPALTAGEIPVERAMVALSELELSGHVRRAPGGRYVPCA